MNAILNRLSRVLLVSLSPLLLVSPSTALLLYCSSALLIFPSPSRADIFQWEYLNPADPSQGKQKSTTLAPDGAGVDAVPGADLSYRDLTMAYLIGADLSIGGLFTTGSNLAGTNLSRADLTNAILTGAILTDADFTDADVRGASFVTAVSVCSPFFCNYYGTGISLPQLYSTASYQARELSGINFGYNDLSGGSFGAQNLTDARFEYATLTDANFRRANLSNVYFNAARLRDADFSKANLANALFEEAMLTGADFSRADLTYTNFYGADVTGANFAGQNLANTYFSGATLSDADFTNAEVQGAHFSKEVEVCGSGCFRQFGSGITLAQLYSTASYQAHDLRAVDLGYNNLAGGDFVGQNLRDSDFSAATLTDADFTGADVRGTIFSRAGFCLPSTGCDSAGTGITPAQLYSTASYQAHDLTGIYLGFNDLSGANFAGQNLAEATFVYATLTAADFRNANLTNASFYSASQYSATLTDADFTAADARGADLVATDAITASLIEPDGHVDGLDFGAVGLLLVRDYDGDSRYEPDRPPIPITIDEHLSMGPGGTLRMVFDADAWDSTISFAPGIPVSLGGTLELTFADDVNLATQVGRTFDLFDWTGVTPTGAFAVDSPYAWDLSNLYTTGEVTLVSVPEPRALLLFGFAMTPVIAMGRVRLSSNSAKGENP